MKIETKSELFAGVIFSEGRVAFEHRRFDRGRMSCENDDWFRDLAADRGRRQIVHTEILNSNETSGIFAMNSPREGASSKATLPAEKIVYAS